MQFAGRLPRAFFSRPADRVARDLIGCLLIHRLPDGNRLAGRLVEVEAYLGKRDPGSHAYRGVTPRNRAMFGPAGRLYVYRSYGIHTCANIVCGREGEASAVLLRGLEPLEGLERMRALRGLSARDPERLLASGPGRLAQALGIRLEDYGASVLSGPFQLRGPAEGARRPRVARGPRIGLSAGAELPLRFFLPQNPHVSSTRPGPRGTRKRGSRVSATPKAR